MKIERINTEETIDRVLNGLARVEAPPEFERRVLRAIQKRARAHEGVMLMSTSSWFGTRKWAIAAGIVVLGIAASMAVRKRHEPRPEHVAVEQHTSPVLATEPLTGMAEGQPGRKPRHVGFAISQHRPEAANPEDTNDLDALAISERNAPSKPAPPLPLTHQEKLLAEAVHQASPVDLSSLRPEDRARQMELSKAEFHDFFEPPPAKNNE